MRPRSSTRVVEAQPSARGGHTPHSGTHWYHPHRHGSTALQVGGGLVGLLIVDDAPGEVPHYIAAMDEVVLQASPRCLAWCARFPPQQTRRPFAGPYV